MINKAPEGSYPSSPPEKSDSPLLHLEGTIKNIGKVEANGRQTPDGFLVFSGSQISLYDNSTSPTVIKERRKTSPINEQGILQEDVLFSNPSYATMFVIGKSANGLANRKTMDGKTLKPLRTKFAKSKKKQSNTKF